MSPEELAVLKDLTGHVARIADILNCMVTDGLVTIPDVPASDN